MVIQILLIMRELVHDNLETHRYCRPKMKLPAMVNRAKKYSHINPLDYEGIGTC